MSGYARSNWSSRRVNMFGGYCSKHDHQAKAYVEIADLDVGKNEVEAQYQVFHAA